MILASILITDDGVQDQALAPPVLDNIESFKRHHPGLEHRLFRGPEVRGLIAADFGREVLDAYDALKPYAFKCDLARLCILHKFGGVYADLSVFFAAGWNQQAQLGVFRDFASAAPWQAANTVIYAPPCHKAMAQAIALICENVRRRFYGKNFLCPTGPVCFGKAVAMSCEADEVVTGDSFWCRGVPERPDVVPAGGAHGFGIGNQLVAVKRKRGGTRPDEIGIAGGNAYIEMWDRRDIYEGSKR